jgi:UDP-N-acetylmuramate dehydrogenase
MQSGDPGEIIKGFKKNILLKNYTTFRIGGLAKYFFAAKNKEDLIEAVKAAKRLRLPFFVLGGGSNVLFSDKGYKGLIINLQFFPPLAGSRCGGTIFNFQKNKVIAGAGTSLGQLVEASSKNGLTGLEWAAGIPGTIGGAVRGNAGAFGKAMGDLVEEVEVLDARLLRIKKFSRSDCQFSAKDSIFKKRNNLVVLSVVLKLKKSGRKKIQKEIKKFLNYKKKTQPLGCFSAGCVFQNYKGRISDKKILAEFPELKEFNKKRLIPAGYLIDKCGLKGRRKGKAEISRRHANFIVNLGGAKAEDVIGLIKTMKQKVKRKFGLNLKKEIEIP